MKTIKVTDDNGKAWILTPVEEELTPLQEKFGDCTEFRVIHNDPFPLVVFTGEKVTLQNDDGSIAPWFSCRSNGNKIGIDIKRLEPWTEPEQVQHLEPSSDCRGFYITYNGVVAKTLSLKQALQAHAQGNWRPTREQAEALAEYRRLSAKYAQSVRSLEAQVLDWDDAEQNKWSLEWRHNCNKWTYKVSQQVQSGLTVSASRYALKKAISQFIPAEQKIILCGEVW